MKVGPRRSRVAAITGWPAKRSLRGSAHWSGFAKASGDNLHCCASRRLERVKGIEPSSSAWKAVALPLSYTREAATFRTIRPTCQDGATDSWAKVGLPTEAARIILAGPPSPRLRAPTFTARGAKVGVPTEAARDRSTSPPSPSGFGGQPSLASRAKVGGGSRTRTYEGVASGFTVRPLCRSGHSPNSSGRLPAKTSGNCTAFGCGGGISANRIGLSIE